MKNCTYSFPELFVGCLIAAIVACVFPLRAQEVSTPPHIDPSKLFITDGNTMNALSIQTYDRLLIGTWFGMINDQLKTGRPITIYDYAVFAPEKVRVIVKNEPTVVKKDDGTWEITFKEIKP